jgi:CheY-like chemotaxis protein
MTKILVIDDDEQLCEFLEKVLIRDGNEVTTACDGKEGISRFKSVSPDLVITDIFMPNKSGIEVITELQRINPYVSIIAISGMQLKQLEALDFALLLGARRVLEKPFTRDQLLETVGQALAGQWWASVTKRR